MQYCISRQAMTQRMFHVYQACIQGNLDVVQHCLEDPNTNTVELLSRQFTFDDKLTLLHGAAAKGHTEMMRLLLRHNADVNFKTKYAGNYTPLHLAIHSGKIECVQILLNHDKIDVFAKDDSHNTAYHRSVTFLSKHSDITKVIKTAEIVQASKRRTSDLLCQTLKNVHKDEICEDCFSQALLAAISKRHPCLNVVTLILQYVAKLENYHNLDLITCINIQLHNFTVEITSQLILCWMAVQDHLEQLRYFMGICDFWLPLLCGDIFDLLFTSFPEHMQNARDYIKTMKCTDIAAVINMAISCKHLLAAQLLLTHGSLAQNKRMYEVRWDHLALESLPSRALRNMCHRRQLSGKILEWNSIIRIDLRHNNLTEIPAMMFQLPLLSNLLLSNNQLQKLPEPKHTSDSLNHLYLSHNKLRRLPASFSWSNIRTLKLDDNRFTEVPSCVCKMAELETLDIHDNQIVVLPLELGLLSAKLTTFIYDKQKIEYPQGWKKFREHPKDLIKWLRSMLLKTDPFPTIKLFVIGWQNKGKSTLVRRLRNDLQYFDNEVTPGVEVSDLDIQQKMLLFLPKGTKITFQVWDFAGQKDFHLMHMFFLSSTGLYLLVWNLMDEEAGIQELKIWLNNISCRTETETSVIIVGTHLDCVQTMPNSTKQDVKAYLDKMRGLIVDMTNSLKQDKIHVVDIVEVSSNPAHIQGITELKEKIYKASEDLGKEKGIGVLEEPVPISFHLMVKEIQTLRSTMCHSNELPLVNRDRLRTLMQGIACTEDERHLDKEFVEAVKFLKDRGIILHFDDASQDLRDVYFIDPRWLFSLMNHVISNSKTDDGLVKRDQLFPTDCKEITFTEKYVTQGIRLLSRFHLIHALDDNHLLMPSRFPKDRPDKKRPVEPPLRRIYRVEHIPHGFFSRLLARLLHYMETMITEAYDGQRSVTPLSNVSLDAGVSSLPSSSPSSSSSSSPIPIPISPLRSSSLAAEVSSSSPPSTTTAQPLSSSTATPLTSPAPSAATQLSSSILSVLKENPKDSSRLSVKKLKQEQSLQWWDRGLQLNLQEISVVIELVEEEEKPVIKISCLQSWPGNQMLVLIIEHVEAIISEWFHGMNDDKVVRLIPCNVCEKLGLEDQYIFTLKECLELSKTSESLLKCPRHDGIPLHLNDLAPDISLQDVNENLVFQSHHLVYDENSFIKEGSYGKVYRAVLNRPDRNRQTVAVKQFTGDVISNFMELRKEVNILRRINHPNLIQMIGVVCSPRCTVFEFAPSGSLDSILFDTPLIDIPRLVTVYIALEIVDALACLHRSEIIHRDLKPANVLVFSLEEDDALHVKVADFGTANFAGPSGMRKPVGPTHIKAPEILEFALKEDYGTEVDIYSFAMLLFALITRKRAFEDLSSDEIKCAVLQQKRPLWRNAKDAMNNFANLTRLMCVAWNQNPADRPTAEECAKQLRIPHFQALMSKLAFPANTDVLYVQLMPSKEELWVAHQTKSATILSLFSSKFDSSSAKQSYIVSSERDTHVKICGSQDKVIFLLKKYSSEQGMFRIYSISDASHPISINCSLPNIVYDIAASDKHVFVASKTACLFGSVELGGGTMEMHQLPQDPVSTIIASASRLWVPRVNTIEMYTIIENSQDEPLIYCSSIPMEGVKHLRCCNDTIWVLTTGGFVKLNEEGEVISRLYLQSHDPQMPSLPLTCFVPVLDTLLVGWITGGIWVFASDTGSLITHFRAHSYDLYFNLYADPQMVISRDRLTKDHDLGQSRVISPLSIDCSEIAHVKDSHTKLCGKTLKASPMTQYEGNWEAVDDNECGDVLIAWQALSRDSWIRH